jgi:NAD(P)H-nitrite reductase large subunit
MRETFDLYVGGDPKGIKATTAILLLSGLTEEKLAPINKKIIDYYRENAKGKEKFGKFINRVTLEQLRHIAVA